MTSTTALSRVVQSCSWVGLTHGLGWEWVENFCFFSGLGWVMGLK